MSMKTKMMTGVLTVLTAGALVSFGAAPSHADVRCQQTNAGRPLRSNRAVVPSLETHEIPGGSSSNVAGIRSVRQRW